jgi:predicted methyltransferase
MTRKARWLSSFWSVPLALACALACADSSLESLVGAEHRSEKNIERNIWRHPIETLKFFGLRKDMRVLEVWPGSSGWYAEILAPYLRKNGQFIAANYSAQSESEYRRRGVDTFNQKMLSRPEIYDRVIVTTLAPPDEMPEVERESVDLIISARNLHNWIRAGSAETMFSAMFTLLKPGGGLGLVAHRGTKDMVGVQAARKGYLAKSEALRLALGAGFVLEAESEINANPRDTKNYPAGVWTLPPVLRLGQEERSKYLEIGESDRMTLLFRKPN